MVSIKQRELPSPATCPYCRDAIDEAPEACAGCGAEYHSDCLLDELSGACAVLGCGASRSPRRADPGRCGSCSRGFGTLSTCCCPICETRYHRDCVGDSRCTQPGCGGELDVWFWEPQATTDSEEPSVSYLYLVFPLLLGITFVGLAAQVLDAETAIVLVVAAALMAWLERGDD